MATARRRIGIKDVAAAAGVSTTTVSHALSGKGRLPEATRESIAEIAAELGYRPNTSARNLVAGKTGLLGITVSASPDAPFGLGDFDYFIQLLSAATGAAVEGGQALVVEGAALGANAFSRVDIDGAIVIDPVSDDPLLASLDARGIPIVTTGRRDDGSDSGTPATGSTTTTARRRSRSSIISSSTVPAGSDWSAPRRSPPTPATRSPAIAAGAKRRIRSRWLRLRAARSTRGRDSSAQPSSSTAPIPRTRSTRRSTSSRSACYWRLGRDRSRFPRSSWSRAAPTRMAAPGRRRP